MSNSEVYYCSGQNCYSAEVNKIEYIKDERTFYIIASKSNDLQVQAMFSIDAKEFKRLAIEHLGLIENTSDVDNSLFDVTFTSAFFTVTGFYFLGKSVGALLTFIKREALS